MWPLPTPGMHSAMVLHLLGFELSGFKLDPRRLRNHTSGIG